MLGQVSNDLYWRKILLLLDFFSFLATYNRCIYFSLKYNISYLITIASYQIKSGTPYDHVNILEMSSLNLKSNVDSRLATIFRNFWSYWCVDLKSDHTWGGGAASKI